MEFDPFTVSTTGKGYGDDGATDKVYKMNMVSTKCNILSLS